MRAIFVLLLTLGVTITETVQALEIEQFFMPGDLISEHRELESECTSCHVRGRDTTQNKLCLDCHDHALVAEDIREKQGFHGRDKNAGTLECKSCHSDHKGRDARVVWLNKDNFDHQFTDFRLSGKHELVECTACHLKDKKYREAKQTCYECHSEDDVHEGDLGKQCQDCHEAAGWTQTGFDHGKTDFELKFAHQQVSCNACHIAGQYKDTPKQCVDCHAIRDVHVGRFGKKCESCHREKAWDKSIFDHNQDTRYKLEGKHRRQACNDCHADDYKVSEKHNNDPRNCYSCHRTDDVHNKLNGKKCQDCHVPRGWRYVEFDHGTNTEFPLEGAHESLVCEACHTLGAKTKKIEINCYSCHKQDDVHKRDQGTSCDQCHNDIAWQNEVRFDHDLSNFALIGQHAVVGCESCHVSSVFSDAGNLCIDCHRDDDLHKQGLGEDCSECHNPNAWLIWRFDHEDTNFKLRDAHTEIHCHTCHNRSLGKFTRDRWSCLDCHRRDDVHDGNFGRQCDKCHNQKSFKLPEFQSLNSFESRTIQSSRIGQ